MRYISSTEDVLFIQKIIQDKKEQIISSSQS